MTSTQVSRRKPIPWFLFDHLTHANEVRLHLMKTWVDLARIKLQESGAASHQRQLEFLEYQYAFALYHHELAELCRDIAAVERGDRCP